MTTFKNSHYVHILYILKFCVKFMILKDSAIVNAFLVMENPFIHKSCIIILSPLLQNLQQFLYSIIIQAFIHKSHDILEEILFPHVYYSHYWYITDMISQSAGLKAL